MLLESRNALFKVSHGKISDSLRFAWLSSLVGRCMAVELWSNDFLDILTSALPCWRDNGGLCKIVGLFLFKDENMLLMWGMRAFKKGHVSCVVYVYIFTSKIGQHTFFDRLSICNNQRPYNRYGLRNNQLAKVVSNKKKFVNAILLFFQW